VVLVALAGLLWVAATESGTRWLFGRLESRLPAALSIETVRGSLLGGLGADAVAWNDESGSVLATDASIDFELLPLLDRHLVIDALEIDALDIKLSQAATEPEDAEKAPFSLPIDISVSASSIRNITFERGEMKRFVDHLSLAGEFEDETVRVSRLEFRSAWLDLDLSGSGALDQPYPLDIRANWRWTSPETTISGYLEASGNRDEYLVHHELEAPHAISTSGTVSLANSNVSVDLENHWTSLELSLAERTLRSPQGKLRVTGGIDDFVLELEAGISVDDRAEARVWLAGNGQWEPAPRFNLKYDISELDPSLATDFLTGSLASKGTLALAIDNGLSNVTVGIEQLDGELNGYAVSGHATVAYANQQTAVSDAIVRLGDNTVSGSGQFGNQLQINAALDIVDLGQIFAGSAGSLQGRIAAAGDLEHPEANIDLQGANIAWQDYFVAAFDADARFDGEGRGGLDVRIEGATVAAAQIDTANIALEGRPEKHEFRVGVQAFGSKLDVEASGRFAKPSWFVDLREVTLANEAVGTWSSIAPGRLELGAGRLEVERICLQPLDGAGQACAMADLAEGVANAELSIDALPLAALPLTMPPGITLDGTIKAGMRARKTEQDLTATSELELQNTRIEAHYDGEHIVLGLAEAVASASFADGLLESSARIALADRAGSANAKLAVREGGDGEYPIDGSADVMVSDASVFALFLPSINKPRGRISGELTVVGTAGAPEFVGEIAIEDGAFGVRQTGIEISDVNLRISQSQPGQVQLAGSAHSGDGYLAVEGITRISQVSGIRSEIRLHGEDFELARLPDWQFAASPSITTIIDNYVTTVVGQLTIPSAKVTLRELPETAQKSSPDTVVYRQDESEPTRRRRIDLHLRTSLGDGVQFSGFGLTTGLEGALQLRGGTHAPYTGQGRLSLVGGRYTAYGQELEIERGNLVFTGPLDEPLLDIRAIRRTPDVIAGIQLSGTPSRLQSFVFSDPALGDAEALSYLLTGRPLATSMDTGEGDTLNKAAFALGLSGAGLITSQIRTQLGLETLTIEGSKEESRLVAGKRLGNRLVVEYGYGLVDKLGTLLLRYQLTDRFMLESRSGTVSNLDLLYRARKR